MDDWGIGYYEDTASELAPVSDVAVAALELSGGERLLDIACGTGNAALVAEPAGAAVVGLDSSLRLLEVAQERVRGGRFVCGDAARLPFSDARFDAIVSVFGVIYVRPAEAAVAEIARVVRPGGRLVITTWPPRGPMFGAVSLMRSALADAGGEDAAVTPANWGDPSVIEALLGRYGEVAITEEQLRHADSSPEAFWDRWERLHPIWIGARTQLEPRGEWESLRVAVIEALVEGGIGRGASSPYLLATLRRH